MKITVGETIKKYRKEKHLTQKELAAVLETSASTVGMYEQNRREPDIATILHLAAFFEISVDELLGQSAPNGIPEHRDELTQHDRMLLRAYHAQTELQPAVNRLLGLEENGKILLWTAASSLHHQPEQVIAMDKSEWETIKNAPETKDPLL